LFVVTVLYPAKATFNMDYYMQTHMPLVRDGWRAWLKGDSVVKVAGSPAGEPTYQVITQLSFESQEGFQAAFGAAGAKIMGDIPNFTDGEPVVQLGATIG
jgi:uncharacterized protein (TIGR02118 family)